MSCCKMALNTMAICMNAETLKAPYTAIYIYSNLTAFSHANASLLFANAHELKHTDTFSVLCLQRRRQATLRPPMLQGWLVCSV